MGLLVILCFILSTVPSSTMSERINANTFDLLAGKSIRSYNIVVKEATGKELPDPILNFYDYCKNTLHIDLSMVEFLHLMEIMKNKSGGTGKLEFYVAYTTAPNVVDTFNFGGTILTDTPKNIYNKVAITRGYITSWDEILVKYGKMTMDERADYINTQVVDLDNVYQLYERSSLEKQMYMFESTLPSLKKLNEIDFHEDKSKAWWLGHLGTATNLADKATVYINEFVNESKHAYNKYDIDETAQGKYDNITNPNVNTTLEELIANRNKVNNIRLDVEHSRDTFYFLSIMGISFAAAFLPVGIGAIIAVIGTPASLGPGIILTVFGSTMLALHIVMDGLWGSSNTILSGLDDIISTLDDAIASFRGINSNPTSDSITTQIIIEAIHNRTNSNDTYIFGLT